jgi:Fe-S cluster assembly protein SufD
MSWPTALPPLPELLPTTRHEDWKYTSLRAIAGLPFVAAPRPEVEEASWVGLPADALALVFVNGYLSEGLSRLGPWAECLSAEAPQPLPSAPQTALRALSDALAPQRLHLRVPAGVAMPALHVVCVAVPDPATPLILSPRLSLALAPQAEAMLIETHRRLDAAQAVGEGEASAPTFTNVVIDVRVDQGAHLTHVKVQHGSADGFHIADTRAWVARDGRWTHQNLILGGRLSRDDVSATLAEPGAEAHLHGLYLCAQGEHIDVHSAIDHAAPNCHSDELYKGVLKEDGAGVFNGKIFVRQDAQKTAAFQSNRNLLLSPQASINTKPQLEIWADDVRCTHGCTVGQLETAPLFYMRSRGIPDAQAKALLTYAFAGEVIERVAYEPLKDALRAHLGGWMGADLEGEDAQ